MAGAFLPAAAGSAARVDMDVWVRPTPANAARAYAALRSFGAPLLDLREEGLAVLSRELLLRNKRAVGRTQDLADVEWLEANQPGGA